MDAQATTRTPHLDPDRYDLRDGAFNGTVNIIDKRTGRLLGVVAEHNLERALDELERKDNRHAR